MATTVQTAQARDKGILKLERQMRELQRKLDNALRDRSGATPHTVAPDPRTDRDVQRHQRLRKNILPYLGEYTVPVVLTAPIIYSTIFALLILDVFLTLYQWICFPVYGIERVKRREFIVIDRHQLAYLNAVEKFNCVFCGYANGLLAYSAEIASLTEAFWCPIKHAARTRGLPPRTDDFAGYLDAAGYRMKQKHNGQRAKRAACRKRACHACRPHD